MTHTENSAIQRDFMMSMLTVRIGAGLSRIVYDFAIRPDLVAKVEDGSGRFQNVIEWDTWDAIKGTPWRKWFAECVWISSCGTVLLQKKTQPLRRDEYPARMPQFLGDFKYANYGRFGKQVVCHDYGTNLLKEYGMSNRMKKAEWWE